MPSKLPSYQVRNEPERHAAIKMLAEKRGFKSVSDYINRLIDEDARQHGFKIPSYEDNWGGSRESEIDETK